MTNRTPTTELTVRPPCFGRWTFLGGVCDNCAAANACRRNTCVDLTVRLLATPRSCAEPDNASRPDVEINLLAAMGISPRYWPTLYTLVSHFHLKLNVRSASAYRISFKDNDGKHVIVVRRLDSARIDMIARRVHIPTALELGWKLESEERGRVSLVYATATPVYENFFPSLRKLLTVSAVHRTFTP